MYFQCNLTDKNLKATLFGIQNLFVPSWILVNSVFYTILMGLLSASDILHSVSDMLGNLDDPLLQKDPYLLND